MPDTNSELTSFDRRMLRQFQEEYEAEEAVLSRLKAEARAIDERNAGRLHDLDRQLCEASIYTAGEQANIERVTRREITHKRRGERAIGTVVLIWVIVIATVSALVIYRGCM